MPCLFFVCARRPFRVSTIASDDNDFVVAQIIEEYGSKIGNLGAQEFVGVVAKCLVAHNNTRFEVPPLFFLPPAFLFNDSLGFLETSAGGGDAGGGVAIASAPYRAFRASNCLVEGMRIVFIRKLPDVYNAVVLEGFLEIRIS